MILSKDYKAKMNLVLSNSVYKKLNIHPKSKTERKITCFIKKSHFPENVTKKLIPHVTVPPRIYGLLKIHKAGLPLRPIINCISSPNTT